MQTRGPAGRQLPAARGQSPCREHSQRQGCRQAPSTMAQGRAEHPKQSLNGFWGRGVGGGPR